jgi:transcription elongation factor
MNTSTTQTPAKQRAQETKHETSLKEPDTHKIALWVCGCCKSHWIEYWIEEATEVTRILNISIEELIEKVRAAISTSESQVVATLIGADIAETRCAQLNAVGKFLVRSSHTFILLK